MLNVPTLLHFREAVWRMIQSWITLHVIVMEMPQHLRVRNLRFPAAMQKLAFNYAQNANQKPLIQMDAGKQLLVVHPGLVR